MKYIYRKPDSESQFGPCTFRQLVLLVSDGEIDPNDKICAEDDTNWQYAADVPGLFHMAGRMEVVEEWYAEMQASAFADDEVDVDEEDAGFALDELDSLLEVQDTVDEIKEEPAWRARLRFVEEQKAAEAEQAELAAGSRMGSVSDEALAEMDRESKKRRRFNKLSDTIKNLVSSGSQRLVLRLVLSFVAANLTAYWILSWSETEAQRAPDVQELAAGVRAFPVYGKCSSGEFMFLTIDAMLLAGVVGFFGANALEAVADD